MTGTGAMVVPIFATPFSVVPVGPATDLNAKLAELLSSRATEEYRDATTPRNPLCYRSREDLLEWDHEAVLQLRREMLRGICAAVMAVNECTQAEFEALRVQARARFVIVRPNGHVPAASAPMASWYALHCVAAPPAVPERPDSAAVRLYGIRHGTTFKDAANWRLRTPFSDSHHLWRPVSGEMAVFPASILHEVALNRGQSNLVLIMARVRFAHGGEGAMLPW